jgi:hypothetical protein
MSRFLLLLRDDPSVFASLSPDQMQAIIQRYIAWGQALRAGGRLISSDKLKDGEGRVVRRTDQKPLATDGPFAESRELVGGFYLIEAHDYDDAMRIVADCPHLEFGSIEIRQIHALDGH